jgi:hypothetical protein
MNSNHADSATNDSSEDVVSPPYLDQIFMLCPRKSIANVGIQDSSIEVNRSKSRASTLRSKDIIVHMNNTKLLGPIHTPK